MRQLFVYHNDTVAGTLTEVERGGRCRLEYDAEYLASPLQGIGAVNVRKQ